jgi:hypothetical protein
VTTVLRIFLIVYMLYAYAKFARLFASSPRSRKRWLKRAYAGSAVKIFDNVMLVLMVLVAVATLVTGADALSFTSGLLVGMTLVQIFFHRFADPLADEWMPPEPVTPLRLMSHAIQAMPSKAWREFAVMSALLAYLLFALVTGR